MTLQNRVTPLGELVAEPGARARLRQPRLPARRAGTIRRRFAGRRWIACRLEFRGWHRAPLLQPGKFTELFFLDEATAMAAGHRPCALCRREDYNAFVGRLARPPPRADGRRRHRPAAPRRAARSRRAARRLHDVAFDDLPDGAFVLHDGEPWLVLGAGLLHWTTAGYDRRAPRPGGRARAITPPSLMGVLRAGWDGAVPLLHPSVRG